MGMIIELISIGISTPVSAKFTAIDITGSDGKVYEYDYGNLKTSTVQYVLDPTSVSDKLYNDFTTRKTTLSAFYDDVKQAYIDANIVK